MSIVSAKTSSGASGIPQELHEDCCDSATAVSCVPSSSASLLKGVGIGQTHQAESTSGYEAFGSSICLHFRGLKDLAAQLCGVGSSVGGLRGNEPGDQGLNWKDVGGRIAVTEVGGAAVEAGIAPWEAAEIFADIFKTSILGLCADTELHLLFLAAVAVGGEMQPNWHSYLSVYDKLDPAGREAIKAQGVPRHCINDTADLLLLEQLNFTQLRRRVELEAHRRFFFALLLHDVYREGTAYQSVWYLAKCTDGLRSAGAALSEICFVLAGKLKLACSPAGALASALTDPSRQCGRNHEAIRNEDDGGPAALQQLLQLDGMTPRRAAALRAAQIYTCAQVANTPLCDLYKALEAAEPAQLAPTETAAQSDQKVWGPTNSRLRARLLTASVKLKDAAQKEQEMRMQALEDEAAGHWSLIRKATNSSGDEDD
ncbi:hypothetical protein, conserved [Eimeria maxima]|uniref:POLQ-like helical domain-containing protein n=1 Tax=Eimeria maxima TaxID=5804 RepID=U6M6G7_EIMMA|nr:hypothetical protein, conserved [Eimeria maxima]CDJ58029.1 hypothetical protein, conserved [Eimeria maxima]